MDLLIAANSVAKSAADTAPSSGTPQYATDGNPVTGIYATTFPAYHYNMLMGELYNLIIAAGLTPSGSDWTQVGQAVQALGDARYPLMSNSFRSSAVYSTSGIFTVPAGVTVIRVQVWAAGGGGGAGWLNYDATGASAGGGGGGGGYGEGIYTVTPGQALSVTVGAAGALGTSSSNATAGGSSSVGSLVTATGGQPGSNASSSSIGFGGLGGSSSGSNKFSVGGTYGSNGFNIPGGAGALGGAGGGTFNSGSTWHAQGAAASGNFPGGGGGGAGGGDVPAGSGASGFVIIQY